MHIVGCLLAIWLNFYQIGHSGWNIWTISVYNIALLQYCFDIVRLCSHTQLVNVVAFIITSAYKQRNDTDLDKRYYAYLRKQADCSPNDYGRWPFPSMWMRGEELEKFFDVIMHLFFLGITQSVVDLTVKFLARKRKHSSFCVEVEGRLEAIESLGLCWCKTLGYKKGGLGGWVSENYVALAKVSKWFYSDIRYVNTTEEFVEPGRPQTSWCREENAGWLHARGLKHQGSAKELKD